MTLMTTQPREMAADKLSRALDELREARSNVSSAERVHATAVENLASARHRLAQAEQAYNNALFELTGGEPPAASAVAVPGASRVATIETLSRDDGVLIIRGMPLDAELGVGSIAAAGLDPNGQRTEIPVDGLPIGDVAEWNGR